MEFEIGCELEEFKEYHIKALGYEGKDEIYWIQQDPSHLIVWREESQIIGHAIWHPSSSREHRPGMLRDEEDTCMIEELLGGKGDFVELHELWLTEKHRGKGYGHMFFDFFEQFIRNRGYRSIVFYAYNEAAISLCKKRGYQGVFGYENEGVEGRMETMYIFHIAL
ncbi:MAG: GNAT family N-acetyltransferase [Candidatus Heimdallarchaeaceae archaeon]|jgi:GNAT superfamily N-acetyltransferase